MDPIYPPSRTVDVQSSRNRQLLITLGVVIVAVIVGFAIWQTTGTHGAKRDVAAANARIADKQKEMNDARRVLDQKVAELRGLRAEADAEATKLGSTIARQVEGTVNDARVDLPADAGVSVSGGDVAAPEYYVRDRYGRFVPVTRP